MIGGLTTGAGGRALGGHLADHKKHNELTAVGSARGLLAETTEERIQELTKLASASRSKSPIAHFHADPPEGAKWGDSEFSAHWQRLEKEFGLERQPYAEAIHEKGGREHRHRVYSLYDEQSRSTIKLSHSYARIEKLSRIAEFDTGQQFTKGRHNRAVAHALEAERPEVAEAIRNAGLTDGPRPSALRPQERAQQERTLVSKAEIATATATAWASSDNGQAFAMALKDSGLYLAMGDKTALVVDSTGNAHSLQRMLSMYGRSTGEPSPKSADISNRLEGMDLPSLDRVRQEIRTPAPMGNPDPTPPQAPPPPVAPVPTDKAPQQAQAMPVQHDKPSQDRPQAHGLGGGGGGSPSPSPSSAAPSLEPAGDGPGEPPRVGASPDELAKFRAKLHDYQERKEKNLQRFMQALAAHEEGKKRSGNQPVSHHEEDPKNGLVWRENGITEALRQGYERKEAERELSAALEGLARWNHGGGSEADKTDLSARPSSERAERQGGQSLGRDDDTQGLGRPDPAPDPGRLHSDTHGSGGTDRGESGRNLAENARINFALAFTDMTRLEKAREALRPALPDPTEGMGNREKHAALKEWKTELFEQFKRDKSDLRFVQRHEWKGAFSQLRHETDAVKAVLQKHRGRISPEMYREAFEARKTAREALGKSLKEGQDFQKESFSEWLQREAHSNPKALAVHQDTERRRAEKLAIDTTIENEQNRIASQRARAPFPDPATRDPDAMERRVRHAAYAPLHAAQDSLKAAIEKLADTPKATGIRAFFGIPTAASRARDEAEKAVALGHASVESAKPNRSTLEDARHHARHGAEHAAKVQNVWQQTHGQELDLRESLILGIQESLENGDPKMKKVLLEGGIEAALKLQAVREAEELRRIQEQQKLERGNVVPMQGRGFPAPKMR
jgi:hypothetical protein